MTWMNIIWCLTLSLWNFCEHNSEYSELQQFSSCINNKLLSMKLNNNIIKHFTTLSCLKLIVNFHISFDRWDGCNIWFNCSIICCNEISGFYIYSWIKLYCLFVLELRLTLKISSKPLKYLNFPFLLLLIPLSQLVPRGRWAASAADRVSAPWFKEIKKGQYLYAKLKLIYNWYNSHIFPSLMDSLIIN